MYRGRQHETLYRRLDDGRDQNKAVLEARARAMDTGEFYSLVPPLDDHYVKTVSDEPSGVDSLSRAR